ncbi:MAG: hypothetical protein K2G88_04545 [Oscillospiraceae bacterium]|nr:hypothetical protein [Oscillospiraceae bacterium]
MRKQICILALILAINLTGCSMMTELEVKPEILSSEPVTTEFYTETQKSTKATFPHKETEIITQPVTEIIPQSEQILYEKLYLELSQYHETIKFNYKINPDELAEAMNILEHKNPEIFWINRYSLSYNEICSEVNFKIMNQYTPEQLKNMSEELNTMIQQITKNLENNLSDYEKILQIHDYLVIHTEYDSDSALLSEKGIWSTAYGCLINNKAVCQGYAQAFQLLMNALDITCGICSGTAKNEPHAWNYVLLNQKYYWVDVTWDDPVMTEYNNWIQHGYFLINDEMLFRSRNLDGKEIFKPECNSLENNYFVRENNYLLDYQFSEIDKMLSEHVTDGKIEIMFATETAYQACIQDLFSNNNIWNAEIFQETGGSVNYQQDPNLYILRLIFDIN